MAAHHAPHEKVNERTFNAIERQFVGIDGKCQPVMLLNLLVNRVFPA